MICLNPRVSLNHRVEGTSLAECLTKLTEQVKEAWRMNNPLFVPLGIVAETI